MNLKGHTISIKQLICLVLYYTIAKRLPDSNGGIKFGTRYRGFLCKRIFKKCGKHIMVHKNANFGIGIDIEIGDNSDLGINCVVPNGTIIGSNVLMAPNCYIFPYNHKFDDITIPIRSQGKTERKITVIGDDVWIGRNVTMMPGRTIKKGSIIGACCVLTKDFPEYSVVGGNPSRLLKTRGK